MNYYERHLGDYARDAGHLSMLEHGAYTLLLDRYYTTEHPIPGEQVYRICRAKSRFEKDAVNAVLTEFFVLRDGCWVNTRAEFEIGAARKRIASSKSNGQMGGRPKKPAQSTGHETQPVCVGFHLGSENGNPPQGVSEPGYSAVTRNGYSGVTVKSNALSNSNGRMSGEQEIAIKTKGGETQQVSIGFPNQNPTETQPKAHQSPGTIHQEKPKEKPKTPRRADALLATLDPQVEGLDPEAWRQFVEYRRGIGKGIKPPSVKAAQRRLVRLSLDGSSQAAIVAQSIENGWQGLFALTQEASRSAPRSRMNNRTYGPGGKI